MRLYLEPSVLVKLFKVEAGSDSVVEIVGAIDDGRDWAGVTSQWSTLEVARALRKDGKPKELVLLDVRELRRHRISFAEVEASILKAAEDIIASYEVYASDALHAATFKALEGPERLDAFLCDDRHSRRLGALMKAVTPDELEVP